MLIEDIQTFLNTKNYDVRITHRARWIDQKCTPDVLAIIADCILEYTQNSTDVEFSINDIWLSNYAKINVMDIFSKPDTHSKNAKNEYDKFFSQPINLFEYSGVLLMIGKVGNKGIFRINNLDILEYISMRESNSLNFLLLYIKKVLEDSDIYSLFEKFFNTQDKDNYKELKDAFTNFTIENTKINNFTECYRIFTKIINPLAFSKKKKGTRKGVISNTIITLDEIRYNRLNWRDELNNKEKMIARKEHEKITTNIRAKAKYDIQKAKKLVRKYNEKYNNGFSEIRQTSESNINATQIHHIFPQSQFPSISDYIENLIAITPNQHFSMAHPNNQTTYINKDFQYICLLAKTTTIKDDTTQTYRFDNYTFVLDTGLNTEEFKKIDDLDFATLLRKIDYYYSDIIDTTKYRNLVVANTKK